MVISDVKKFATQSALHDDVTYTLFRCPERTGNPQESIFAFIIKNDRVQAKRVREKLRLIPHT